MTPRGRIHIRREIYFGPEQQRAAGLEDDSQEVRMERAECEGFRSTTDPVSDSGSEDEIIDEPPDESLGLDELPEPEPESRTDALDEDNGDTQCPEDGLCRQAEIGLIEILNQYQTSEQEKQDIIGLFQEYITAAPSDLPLKPIADNTRYPWAILDQRKDGWSILADIALRLEALVCNEAVSERTNGTMRRMLAPLSLRMGRKTLLSRLTIAKHADSVLEKAAGQSTPARDPSDERIEEPNG
jgi:hypothetical protein